MTQTLGELGESEILARILARTPQATSAIVGPGDDAAVLRVRGDLAVTTDTLIEGPDFRRAWTSAYDLGWKAAVVNLADVAAMGATPTGLVVALAAPGDLPAEFPEQLADGLREACEELAPGCAVVGGDLTQASEIVVAVTAFGELAGEAPLLRSGARPGDVVALAGEQGLAVRGLRLLFRRFTDGSGLPVPVRLDELDGEERRELAAQLRPHPPLHLAAAARAAGATAMMDVSDGLALDARRLAKASGATLSLRSDALGSFPDDALHGGEDHSLLATFPAGSALPEGFRAVGAVVVAGEDPLLVDGEPFRARGGWDPYRDWSSSA